MWLLRRKQNQVAQEEAQEALSEARENLVRIKRRGSEVRAISAAQRRMMETNQFAERLKIIMGG